MATMPPDADSADSAPNPARAWGWVKTLAQWLLALGLLGYLAGSGRLSLEQFTFAPGWWRGLAGILALWVAGIFLLSWRLRILLRAVGLEVATGRIVRLTLMGLFFNNIGPGGVGGDLARAVYLVGDTRRPLEVVAALAADRVAGLGAVFFLGLGALLLAWPTLVATPSLYPLAALMAVGAALLVAMGAAGVAAHRRGRAAGVWVSCLLGAPCWILGGLSWLGIEPVASWPLPLLLGGQIAGLGAVLAGALTATLVDVERPDHWAALALAKLPWLGRPLHALLSALATLCRYPRALGQTFLLALLAQALVMAQLWLGAGMLRMETPPTLAQAFFAGPVGMLGMAAPTPGGGLGVAEAAFEMALGLCRTPEGEAVRGGGALFLWLRVVGLAASGVAAAACLILPTRRDAAAPPENDAVA